MCRPSTPISHSSGPEARRPNLGGCITIRRSKSRIPASTTELNGAKRAELLQKAIVVLYDDPPYLFLTQGFGIQAARAYLVNILPRGDSKPTFELIKLEGQP